MSVVSLLGVKIQNNPAAFTDPYLFEITFECLESLKEGVLHCRTLRTRENVLTACRSRMEVDLCWLRHLC
jgi:hypothetical protein